MTIVPLYDEVNAQTNFAPGKTIFNYPTALVNDLIQKLSLSAFPYVTPEEFGAVGDGATDDTDAIQEALDEGTLVMFRPGSIYKITESVSFSEGSVIEGNGASIYCPAASFNNTNSADPQRYGTNSVALALWGSLSDSDLPIANVGVRNLRIYGDFVDGTLTRMLCARNVTGLIIDNVTIEGFAVGVAITLSSVRNAKVTRCSLRTYYTNLDWGSAVAAQATGIEIDNDRVDTYTSNRVYIGFNDIYSFTCGAVSIAANGYQTDGINIVRGTELEIVSNIISLVGEGIDCFGSNNIFANNIVQDAYIFGYKFIYGASFNSCTGNSAFRCGLAGLGFFGVTGDVQGNSWVGGAIKDIDPNTDWGTDGSCILLSDIAGADDVLDNSIKDVVCDPGTTGPCVIKCTLKSTSPNRINFRPIRKGTVLWVDPGAGLPPGLILEVDNPTNVYATMNSSQAVTTIATVNFDIEQIDSRGEFNTTTHAWTCQIPGWYEFIVPVGTDASAVSQLHQVLLRRSGSSIAFVQMSPSNAGAYSFPTLVAQILCAEADVISVSALVGGSTFTISAAIQMTRFLIRPLVR